jgi:hypothetical protein
MRLLCGYATVDAFFTPRLRLSRKWITIRDAHCKVLVSERLKLDLVVIVDQAHNSNKRPLLRGPMAKPPFGSGLTLSARFYTPTNISAEILRAHEMGEGTMPSIRGVTVMKTSVLSATLIGLALTLASAPARSDFTIGFNESGGCNIIAIVGTNSGCTSQVLATDPTGLVSGSVLVFNLPQLVFTGNVNILDPNGVTISDRLRFIDANNSFSSCDPNSGLSACGNRMIFYSFDSNNLAADVGPVTGLSATLSQPLEDAAGNFVFNTPNGVNQGVPVTASPRPRLYRSSL